MMLAWPGFCGHWAATCLRKDVELRQGREGKMSLELPRKGKECKLGMGKKVF